MDETDLLQLRLDYRFTERQLLVRALTHSSQSRDNYERLEFLGDRVLGLVIAEWLIELRPEAEEGELAKTLAALVSRESLREMAKLLDLAQALRMKASEAEHRNLENNAILADCCEAVIAAVYLDGGIEAARRLIRRCWIVLVEATPQTGDVKTRLQEWSQAKALGIPDYAEVGRTGPDHSPSFVIEVRIKGRDPARGEGTSKRLAERAAAEAMLRAIGEIK